MAETQLFNWIWHDRTFVFQLSAMTNCPLSILSSSVSSQHRHRKCALFCSAAGGETTTCGLPSHLKCICLRAWVPLCVYSCNWRLTGEIGACAVGTQVPPVRVGCVALKQTLVLGQHFGDVEHSRVAGQPLHIDLLVVHPLAVQGVGIVWLRRANDADLPVWHRR